jgi:hypothetical protein
MVTVNSSCCPAGLVWRLAPPTGAQAPVHPSTIQSIGARFSICGTIALMSGYENSEDYGGPPVTWRTYVGAGVFIAFCLFIFLYSLFG